MRLGTLALVSLSLLLAGAYVYASTGLAAEHACDWDRVGRHPSLARALLWWDRAVARVTYVGNDEARGTHLYDTGYRLGCIDEQTTPYFEDAVVAFEAAVGKLDVRYMDALSALASRYMFESFAGQSGERRFQQFSTLGAASEPSKC